MNAKEFLHATIRHLGKPLQPHEQRWLARQYDEVATDETCRIIAELVLKSRVAERLHQATRSRHRGRHHG